MPTAPKGDATTDRVDRLPLLLTQYCLKALDTLGMLPRFFFPQSTSRHRHKHASGVVDVYVKRPPRCLTPSLFHFLMTFYIPLTLLLLPQPTSPPSLPIALSSLLSARLLKSFLEFSLMMGWRSRAATLQWPCGGEVWRTETGHKEAWKGADLRGVETYKLNTTKTNRRTCLYFLTPDAFVQGLASSSHPGFAQAFKFPGFKRHDTKVAFSYIHTASSRSISKSKCTLKVMGSTLAEHS